MGSEKKKECLYRKLLTAWKQHPREGKGAPPDFAKAEKEEHTPNHTHTLSLSLNCSLSQITTTGTHTRGYPVDNQIEEGGRKKMDVILIFSHTTNSSMASQGLDTYAS